MCQLVILKCLGTYRVVFYNRSFAPSSNPLISPLSPLLSPQTALDCFCTVAIMHIQLSRLNSGSLARFNAVGSVITLSDCLNVPEGFIFGHKYISIYLYIHNSNRAKAIKSNLRREKGMEGDMSRLHYYKKPPYKCQGTLI